jgi:hypothetical protein
MMSELGQLTSQTPAIASVLIFIYYIIGRDKRDQKVHSGYMKTINDISKKMNEVGKKMSELTKTNEAVYGQNWNLVKKCKDYEEQIKELKKG